MVYEKHVGIYENEEEFQKDILCSPWVAYIYENGKGYTVRYSSDVKVEHTEFNAYEQLNSRLNVLENNIVTLTEDEYERLVTEKKTTITEADGTIREEEYDPSKFYYTYDTSDSLE